MFSRKIARVEDILKVTSFNGIPVEEIEKRCEPLEDRSKSSDWKNRSSEGFLGRGEKLLPLIYSDSRDITTLLGAPGAAAIASSLRRIIGDATEIRKSRGLSAWCPVVIGPWRLSHSSPPQSITVESMRFNAPQVSPFCPVRGSVSGINPSPDFGETGLITAETEEERRFAMMAGGPDGWDVDHVITNNEVGVSITVAEGVIGFIGEIGFFEGGGDLNPYRVDPVLLSAVLGGTVPAGVAENRARSRGYNISEQLLGESRPMIESARSSRKEGDSRWADEFEEKQRNAAGQIVRKWESIAENLKRRSESAEYRIPWRDLLL